MSHSLPMQASLPQIVGASTFSVVAAALESHVNESRRQGWCLPQQLERGGCLAAACHLGAIAGSLLHAYAVLCLKGFH